MTIQELTRQIVAANEYRLEGFITREQHAKEVANFDRLLAAHGYTWADVENCHAF
jgi:hypothetical protein